MSKEKTTFEIYCKRYKDFNKLSSEKLAINLVEPNSKVLSCGNGREVSFLVKRKCEVTSIDNDERMIKLSKEVEPNAEYIQTDMVNFKTKEKQDYILCIFNSINCIRTKEKRKHFIKTCEDNLKDNGQLILTTSDIFTNWRFMFSAIKHPVNFHYFPSEIKEWFKDTNFKYEKIRCGKFNIIVARKDSQSGGSE